MNNQTFKLLSNIELKELLQELVQMGNNPAPSTHAMSETLNNCIKQAIGFYFMDKYRDVQNSVQFEILNRFLIGDIS